MVHLEFSTVILQEAAVREEELLPDNGRTERTATLEPCTCRHIRLLCRGCDESLVRTIAPQFRGLSTCL